jgi:hypothetical protein
MVLVPNVNIPYDAYFDFSDFKKKKKKNIIMIFILGSLCTLKSFRLFRSPEEIFGGKVKTANQVR